MNKELFFIGEPSEFKTGIKIYPPTVREVITNEKYSLYNRLLTYSQEEIEDEFLEEKKTMKVYPTPIEFLLNNCYHDKRYEKLCKEAFQFFIHEQVTFLYEQKKILIGDLSDVVQSLKSVEDLEKMIFIEEEEFFDFQNAIRECIGKKKVEPPNPNEHPKIKEMKRKARYRDKVKAKQMAKSKDGISFFTTLVSICCMGIGITPLNIGEMSYTALESIFRKYQEKEKYQLDIDSLLAGADSKKIKPKYWIRNFEE